ncbi:MAG TPA: DNA-3-methyladenine glycosylase 2 family protein, partial [Beijerinckiaceae bacterium]|nr:DNA-3-methyladenine glycosylase 2 family protein [Beijerinckiaceae bacterium]
MSTILDSQAVLERGARALARRDPILRRIMRQGATPPLRKREPGVEGLARIIVSQQLSTASAAAIWARLEARFPGTAPHEIAAASDDELRAPGLSVA